MQLSNLKFQYSLGNNEYPSMLADASQFLINIVEKKYETRGRDQQQQKLSTKIDTNIKTDTSKIVFHSSQFLKLPSTHQRMIEISARQKGSHTTNDEPKIGRKRNDWENT